MLGAAMRIDWDDNLILGIPEIDAEHRSLFRVFNQLVEAYESTDGPAAPTLIVNELTGRVKVHVVKEEDLFRRHGLPDVVDHCREHSDFVAGIEDLLQRFMTSGSLEHKEGSLHAIGKELMRHTRESDGAAAAHVTGAGRLDPHR